MADHLEQFALFSAMCDGKIDSQQEENLARLLRTDSATRLRYVRFMDIHASLMSASEPLLTIGPKENSLFEHSVLDWAKAGLIETEEHQTEELQVAEPSSEVEQEELDDLDSGSLGPSDRSRKIGDTHSHASLEGTKRRSGKLASRAKPPLFLEFTHSYGRIAALAVFILAGVYGWVSLHPPGEKESANTAQPIAEIQFVKNDRWIGSPDNWESGTKLYPGQRLDLAEGSVRLRYKNGVTIAIEGPTVFEIASETSFRLVKGKVAVLASSPVEEFQLLAPEVRISNLGTSFGVSCSHDLKTELEVFEGAVEILSDRGEKTGQIVGLGESARVNLSGRVPGITKFISNEGRYTSLLEFLWEDQPDRVLAFQGSSGSDTIQADFKDSPVAGMVDTFHGAVSGKGWVTPWFSSGNPLGETRRDRPLISNGGQYLTVRFYRSLDRVIAREYGSQNKFDPNYPHVISWSWRFEGETEQFRDSFHNSAFFFGNPYFRSATWLDNTWLIGVVGADEEIGERRRVYPMRWFAFDGVKGNAFDQGNMIDTGMELEPGVVYRFVVVVYPDQSRYDFAIQNDCESFTQKGVYFRSKKAPLGNVLHFGLSTEEATCDASFSLDSVRIEQLSEAIIERGLLMEGPSDTGFSTNKILP